MDGDEVVVVEIIFVSTGQGGSNIQLVRFLEWGETDLAWQSGSLRTVFYFQYLEHGQNNISDLI